MGVNDHTTDEVASLPLTEGILRERSKHCLRLVLIGAGALGCEWIYQLSLSYVTLRSILIVDPDRIETHNVAHNRIFADTAQEPGSRVEDAVARPKAQVAAEWLARRVGEDVTVTWACKEIADMGWATLAGADVLLSCTDSALARVETALVARRLRLPMLDGGVQAEGDDGRVSWFAPAPACACYLCGMTARRRAEILAYALSPSLHCQPLGPWVGMGAQEEVAPAVQQTAIRLCEVLKAFSQEREASRFGVSWAECWNRREVKSQGGWTAIRQSCAQDCPLHEETSYRLLPVEEGSSLRAHLPATGAWSMDLPWPVALRSECKVCGTQEDGPVRLASLRRTSRCTTCGATGAGEPAEVLTTVNRASAAAAWTPGELGLDGTHLLLLRESYGERPAASQGQTQ